MNISHHSSRQSMQGPLGKLNEPDLSRELISGLSLKRVFLNRHRWRFSAYRIEKNPLPSLESFQGTHGPLYYNTHTQLIDATKGSLTSLGLSSRPCLGQNQYLKSNILSHQISIFVRGEISFLGVTTHMISCEP
jgi:hypothetical protein